MDKDITLLDYYAGQALAGILSHPDTSKDIADSTLARVTFNIAQAMIEERKKYIKEDV
jgi:hypothetical protein